VVAPQEISQSLLNVAIADVRRAHTVTPGARQWLQDAADQPVEPIAVDVWVLDRQLANIVLVKHRWRRWIPPGGKVEPDETPREAAGREMLEETGLSADLLDRPALATRRAYHPTWPTTLGLSYVTFADRSDRLVPEPGQPASWVALSRQWDSYFPDDHARINAYVALARLRHDVS